MQMMEIASPEVGAFGATKFNLNDGLLRVRFKLETALDPAKVPDPVAEVKKYLDLKRKQIYFKLKTKLKHPIDSYEEYISGYATINDQVAGGMGLEIASGTNYTHGFFTLKAEQGNGLPRHPFSMRAWQHLRTNQPDLIYGREISATGGTPDRVNLIKSLGGIVADVRIMFEGFYKYCSDRNWGREVKVGESWVRLKSPDKIKYGGGLRVRQITMTDAWEEDAEGIYGQVYEYTTEEAGKRISSGVAAYEPIIGADENPMRYAKEYVQSVPLRADNNLFFEYPVNETYFPGPQVGYSKVTVWSLAAASLWNQHAISRNLLDQVITINNLKLRKHETETFPDRYLFPTGATYGTTGKTEHEFFTARDFPVISDETAKQNRPVRTSIPIPFLGNVTVSKMTASQGYSVITNDMHGKPKKVSNYRQQKTGDLEKEPISWVKYNYRSEGKIYDKEKVNVLVNTFKDSDDNTLAPVEAQDPLARYTLGQETEFFIDMRQYNDEAWSGGARVNTDILYLPIGLVPVPVPVPTVWPSVSKAHTQLRTAVTNKVIFRTGILQSTEAYDGGSRILTENLKWDKVTGVPVLTATNNNFDHKVFNYTILAHKHYQGMGAAYQNIGLSLDLTSVVQDPTNPQMYDFFNPLAETTLRTGDEMILYETSSGLYKPVGLAVYVGSAEGDNLLYSTEVLKDKEYRAMITRSGYRNQLSASTGTITALADPSVPGQQVFHEKRITIIK
jgi:hypothetical protein